MACYLKKHQDSKDLSNVCKILKLHKHGSSRKTFLVGRHIGKILASKNHDVSIFNVAYSNSRMKSPIQTIW